MGKRGPVWRSPHHGLWVRGRRSEEGGRWLRNTVTGGFILVRTGDLFKWGWELALDRLRVSREGDKLRIKCISCRVDIVFSYPEKCSLKCDICRAKPVDQRQSRAKRAPGNPSGSKASGSKQLTLF